MLGQSVTAPDGQPALSILDLNNRLSAAIAAAPGLRDVWVVGETSDLRAAGGGHCYFELVEKNDDGSNRSRIRAMVWASTWAGLSARFEAMTGTKLVSGIKIMARVTAAYHPAYGMTVNVTDIDPSYTVGDAVRRRNEILARLTAEGIINVNRQSRWPVVAQRIAVISARGAAGYGDFIHHLFTNPGRFRFSVELFEATMQGALTCSTVIAALDAVENADQPFDCVLIIRGGGSTSDLAAFDNYDLARRVATFSLPVVVGIGHERDVTVLDYVAAVRVKTPTAAAEILIGRAQKLVDALERCAEKVRLAATTHIGDERERITRYAATIPGLLSTAIAARSAWLDARVDVLTESVNNLVRRETVRLDNTEKLVEALSPNAVLARGFTLTRLSDGRLARSVDNIAPGARLTTIFADGPVTSIAEKP